METPDFNKGYVIHVLGPSPYDLRVYKDGVVVRGIVRVDLTSSVDDYTTLTLDLIPEKTE